MMRPIVVAALLACASAAHAQRVAMVHRPASQPADPAKRAMVVMLHGCGQDAADFARGTRMNAMADSLGFVVMWPEQVASAHPLKCWNWYTPAHYERDKGEAAWLAGAIDSVARTEGISASRISLVGISAGAAMAANMVVAYPERFGGLAMHSGIAALAATDVASGMAAMRSGPAGADSLGARALRAMGARAKAIPVIILQGQTDMVVAPVNAGAAGDQWMAVNAKKAPVIVDMIMGVGHAWSGGSAEGTYTAPAGPNATRTIVAFLRDAGALGP